MATGPLTNLALALLLDPEVASLVTGVVVMGGTVEHPGNISPYAEANIAHDPEAARLVFGAPWQVTLVGLDVTMATWLEQPDLDRIEASDTAAGRLAWRIMQHYLVSTWAVMDAPAALCTILRRRPGRRSRAGIVDGGAGRGGAQVGPLPGDASRRPAGVRGFRARRAFAARPGRHRARP